MIHAINIEVLRYSCINNILMRYVQWVLHDTDFIKNIRLFKIFELCADTYVVGTYIAYCTPFWSTYVVGTYIAYCTPFLEYVHMLLVHILPILYPLLEYIRCWYIYCLLYPLLEYIRCWYIYT